MNEIKPEVVAEALEVTADRLETGKYTWITSDYVQYATYTMDGETLTDTRVCAIGGLCETTGETWRYVDRHPVTRLAAKAMRPHISEEVGAFLATKGQNGGDVQDVDMVIHFNDRVAKDKSEVIEAMKLAAKDLRNQS